MLISVFVYAAVLSIQSFQTFLWFCAETVQGLCLSELDRVEVPDDSVHGSGAGVLRSSIVCSAVLAELFQGRAGDSTRR